MVNPISFPTPQAWSAGADFAPLARLPEIYQQAQARQTLANLPRKPDGSYDTAPLFASGDMNLARLGMEIERTKTADTHYTQDFGLRQRAQTNTEAHQRDQLALQREAQTRANLSQPYQADPARPGGVIATPGNITTDPQAAAAAVAVKERSSAEVEIENRKKKAETLGYAVGSPQWKAVINSGEDPELKLGPALSDVAIDIKARQVANGDLSALTNIGRGAQGSKTLEAIHNRAAEILVNEKKLPVEQAARDISEKLKSFKAEMAGQTKEATVGAGREANLNIILKATDAAIPAALEASQKVARTGWVPINRIIQKGQVMTSDPNLLQFGMANLQLAEHWARAMNPTGVMRESDREKALEFLSTTTDPKTYKAAVEQLRTQITRERDAVRSAGGHAGGGAPAPAPAAATPTPGGNAPVPWAEWLRSGNK